MNQPQKWPEVDIEIKQYIDSLIELLRLHLKHNLIGVYVHGSLATGSYYVPKSDMDILVVVSDALLPGKARGLNLAIAHYSETRPTIGNIELSIITAYVAKNIPNPIPFELHYSSFWHDRILKDDVQYKGNQFDTDLNVHLLFVKQKGFCLYGQPIDKVFGDVDWDDFMASVIDEFNWTLEDQNILDSPYYSILNICRTLRLRSEGVHRIYSKDEGGEWGLRCLPKRFNPLIQRALNVYQSDNTIKEVDIKSGGVKWGRDELLAFRDFAKQNQGFHRSN